MIGNPKFYEQRRANATRLLTQRGQACTFTSVGPPVPNDATGGVTTADVTVTVVGVLTTYTDEKTGHHIADRAAGTLVDERRLVVSAETVNPTTGAVTGVLSFQPKAGDYAVLADGVKWRVIESKPANPAGVPVSFELRVKRG